jgi:hypothetical protein
MPSRQATLALVISGLLLLCAGIGAATASAAAPTIATTTTVSCAQPVVTLELPVTCTATVVDGTTTPGAPTMVTGEVEFGTSGTGFFSKTHQKCALVASATVGTSSCDIDYTPTLLRSGIHKIEAGYIGDGTHVESVGSFDLGVNDPTTATVECGATVAAGQATTCTVIVIDTTNQTPGTPEGAVKFSSDGPGAFSTAGTCPLKRVVADRSSCSVTYTPAQVGSGSHKVTAEYQGEATHAKSASSAAIAISDPTATTLACAPAAIVLGATPAQATTCKVSVADTASAQSVPAGEVKLTSDGAGTFSAPACALAADGSCTVTYTPTALGSGTHKIAAAYQGAAGHKASAGTATVALTQTDPTPETIIGKHPKLKGAPKTAAFSFSSDQSPVTFQCKLDKMAFKPCAAAFNTKTLKTKKVGKKLKPVFKLKKGKHTLQVQATNAKGLVDPTPAVYTWTVGKKAKKHKK